MKKVQLLDALMTIVSEECEISSAEILSNIKTTEVVDARHILVKCLAEKGLYATDIARMTNLSKRSVNHILAEFNNRLRFGHYFRNNYAHIQQRLSNNHLCEQ